MIKKLFKYLFLLLSFTFCIGYSSWVTITGVKTDSLLTMIETKPVCYLQNSDGTGKRYFSTVEKALSVSTENSQQQIVMLKTKGNASSVYTITENCTVKAGTTLMIPYYKNDDTTNTPYIFNTNHRTTGNGFGYNNPSTNLTCELRLGENITLTNNGTISIGGVVGGGSGGQAYVSTTVAEYGQFTLLSNATLENRGSINNYGNILESSWCNGSKVYNYSSSNYYSIFTLGEFRGGSITYGMYKDTQSSPFNRFIFANCASINIFEYNSQMKALCTLYANDQYNSTEVVVISTASSSLIQLKPNSRLEFKLNRSRTKPTNESSVVTDFRSLMDIHFYGDFQLNSLKLSLKLIGITFNIDTSKVLFPISHMLNIHLHTKGGGAPTSVYLNQQIKVMPGSEFYIDPNVTVSGSTIVVTDSCADNGTGSVAYPSVDASLEKGISNSGTLTCAPAYFDNSGICNITNLGGYVKTSETNSIMICSSNTVTSKELTGFSGKSLLTTVSYTGQDFPLAGDTYNGGTITKKQNLAAGAYKSNTSNNVEYGRETTTDINYYTINFDANGGTLNCDSSIKFIMIGTSYEISALSVSAPSRRYYNFDGWYLDSACTQSVNGKVVNKDETFTVYAKWILKTYNISYLGTCDGNDFGNFTTTNISSLTYNDLSSNKTYSLKDPTIENSSARFFGWYKDNELQYPISQIDLSLIDLYEDQGLDTIIVFGKFSIAYIINLIINEISYSESLFYIPGNVLSLPNFIEYFGDYTNPKYFEGWYYDSALNTPYVIGDENDSSKIFDNVTLYGKLANKDSSFVVQDKTSSNYDTYIDHHFYYQYDNVTTDFEYLGSLPEYSQFGQWVCGSKFITDSNTLKISSVSIINYKNKTISAKYKYRINHYTELSNNHYARIKYDSTTITLDSNSNAESGSVSEAYLLEGSIFSITIAPKYTFIFSFNRTIKVYKINDSTTLLLKFTNSSKNEAIASSNFTMPKYPITFEIVE